MDEGKFIIEFIIGREKLATYNDIIDKINEEGTELHVFTEIIDHKKERE